MRTSPLGPYSISVVVPVYNSEATLPELVRRLEAVLPGMSSCFELILVNDGSRDSSWRVVCDLVAGYPWIRGIDLMRNYGQHNALLAGIREARHEVIVTMDDDLQHPPADIPGLVEKISDGFDVVYGSPGRMPHSFWRSVASSVTKLALQSAIGVETARHVSAFRAFRTCLRDAFATYQAESVSIDVLLTWATSRFAAIEFDHRRREVGASNYTVWRLITHAINMLTGYSTLPLQFASLMGFAFTAFGFLVLAYVIGRYLVLGGSVPGFPFLASIIAIFSGAQLFALGVIGEYLARMHFRLLGRPPFVVRRRVEHGTGLGTGLRSQVTDLAQNSDVDPMPHRIREKDL